MTRRLLFSYLAIAAIVLLVLEVPLAIFYQERETDRLGVDVERDATVLASLYEEALEEGAPLDPSIAAAYAARTDARVVVVDASGWSVVDTADPASRDFSTRPEIGVALGGRITSGTRYSKTLGTDLLYVAMPVASGGQVHGVVRVTLDTAAVDALVHRFWLGLAAVAAVVLAAVAAIGWAVARSVNRPLRALHAVAARFAGGDLSTTEPDRHAPAEIVALWETMNSMARRLDELLTEHKAFVADASHQLRTPLTALRLRLENLQGDVAAADREADLAAAVDETERLSALVGNLLKLARAERPASPVTVDLVALARERADTWSAVADGVGVALDVEAPRGPLLVAAVSNGVEQILDNLLDNAIDAAPSRSRVTLTVAPGDGRHRLTVADEGPGLSDDLKARALDRFWRLDAAKPGSGLGLPIARALAEASGGSLELRDSPSGGLAVVVALPAVPSRRAGTEAEGARRGAFGSGHASA